MSDFGQCSEPTCSNEVDVRLFDCAHHCMRQVCLQHLIEHDQIIEHNENYFENFHQEIQQLWLTYSSLINETKLHFEYEQKLKKHQQLIREISYLFEINSINIEQYRLMIDKLKQIIEQEKQDSIESYPYIEQIKIEPSDIISTTDELDSLNISLASRLESSIEQQQQRESISDDDSSNSDEYNHEMDSICENVDHEIINNPTKDNESIRKISGECPLWFDGAYGLIDESHGMYICPRRRQKDLYRHLIRYHKLTISSVEKICQAIKNKEDPFRKNLFQITDHVIDQINQIYCPFSIFNTQLDNPIERNCRLTKPQLPYVLRRHLTCYHRMSISNAKKLVQKLKTNSDN